MAQSNRCPSCAFLNEDGALECSQCNFPLTEIGSTPAPQAPARAPEPGAPAEAPTVLPPSAVEPPIRRVRPIRPRPPQDPQQKLQVQLWIVLGLIAVAMVVYTAWDGFKKNNKPAPPPVEGANENMQHAADMARAELTKDSTNVNARIMLANVLYDSGNWSEAIIHYKSALRSSPKTITTMVDLGVCYYNLGDSDDAVSLFTKALDVDPKHPVALFNLGVVAESRENYREALEYFDKATANIAAAPPGMGESVNQSRARVQQKLAGGGK